MSYLPKQRGSLTIQILALGQDKTNCIIAGEHQSFEGGWVVMQSENEEGALW